MANILFKGIQQVTYDYFNSKTVDEKKGYLWFVREPMLTTEEETTGNSLINDRYYIYLGSRCYGSFLNGEWDVMNNTLNAIKEAIGLDDELNFFFNGENTTVIDAFEVVKSWYDALSLVVAEKANKEELLSYITDAQHIDNEIIFFNSKGDKITSIDATPFTTDGILNDVEIVTITTIPEGNPNNLVLGEKYIKFTWNLDGGNKEDYILTSEIGATYIGSESIEISGDNVISLKSADAELVKVDEMPVGGTPLADILLENNIKSISAGNLQQVLEALFSQNLWSENPTRNIPDELNVSMEKPTISFGKTTTQEVGTEIEILASAKTATASAEITYEGFEYGYSMECDNSKDGDIPSAVSISGEISEGSNYVLSFVNNSGLNDIEISNVNDKSVSGIKTTISEGTNKMTVTAYSPTFTAEVPSQNVIYACSSLQKTDNEHVVSASEAKIINGESVSNSAYATLTGDYYAFVGFADTLPTTSDEYRSFIGNGYTRLGKGNVTAGKCDKTYMAVCVPSGWDFSCNTSLGADMRGSFTETGDVDIVLPNGNKKAYKYYALTYKDGAFKDLVIIK